MTEQWLYCKACGSSWFTFDMTEYGIELACWKCEHYIGVHVKYDPRPVLPWWKHFMKRVLA